MARFKLVVEYDGTGLVGWQRQENGPSIQEALERAIYGFCGEAVTVEAAGRTDAGVHALGQVVHFDLARDARPKTVRDALNDHLRRNSDDPRNIAVLTADIVSDDFHARFSATERHYRYLILNRSAPLTLARNRAWHVFQPLDDNAMHQAAQRLVGRHDFTTFRSVHCQADSPQRTLDCLAVRRDGDEVRIDAIARSFLHNQVRAITGTLVQVGEGKRTARAVTEALEARDRAACGPTAPAFGLYLMEVIYAAVGAGSEIS